MLKLHHRDVDTHTHTHTHTHRADVPEGFALYERKAGQTDRKTDRQTNRYDDRGSQELGQAN